MIKLIAFLGNYGKQYSQNRHNTAWLFASSLSFYDNLTWQTKFQGQVATKTINGNVIYYLKPETFMNLSGQSIGELSKFYKIKPEEILVVHDELELPLGCMSLKWSGGLGGHNGLRSTKAVLNTPDFWRLRFGIGRPNHDDIAGYVLSDFSKDEKIHLAQIFSIAENLLNELETTEPEKLLEKNKKIIV